ncbi:MAG TPA: S1C family serine protease [Acidimicrobiia bacterium]|nr:S1C family serine protease [Acidimicrobiia bacterium]
MPGLDDDMGDDEPTGPRPDPGDRPWVHPAELQAFVATPAPSATPPRPREWAIGVVSAVAGVAATVLVLVAFGALGGRDRATIPPPVVTNANAPIDYAVAQRVADSVGPSVVMVNVTNAAGTGTQGSGVVLHTDRVLTSAHLLDGATEVKVSTKTDRDPITAQVIGMDPSTDLCLLAVSGVGPELPEPELVAQPAVGDTVIAVAASRGNGGWTSMGVIQELNELARGSAATVAGLVATSTDTIPTTSGGGLFDPNGRIIGILTSAPGATRTGLAVPIGVALDVAEQLENNKQAAHGAIGVVFGADRAGNDAGATVGVVLPDGPAATADPPLQAGDVITRAGDTDVNGMVDLIAVARRRHPTEQLELIFERNGRLQRTRVELGTAGPSVDIGFGPAG